MNKVGGIIEFKINSQSYSAKGHFTYNLGKPKKESIVGSDGTHGFKTMPQPAKIEGAITDGPDFDFAAFLAMESETVTLSLANGKVIVLSEAWNSSEGDANTEEGEIAIMIEAIRGEEIRG